MKIWMLGVLGCLFSAAGFAEGRSQVYIAGQTVTAKALARQLELYVAAERALKGGVLWIWDEELEKPVAVKPVKLDDGDHIHWLGEDRFLTWGEFKDGEGNLYFLDFYLRLGGRELAFSDPVTIYSRNKIRRYAWDESGEVMRRKPLTTPEKR